MSKAARRLRISEAQANAEALARRAAPALAEHRASVAVAWDFRQRQPRNLREAVHYARQAYADEVPERLHDGPDAIGPAGTPRFAARAEGYLFGSPMASDVSRDPLTGAPVDLISFYHTPFHAALERMRGGSLAQQRQARIVAHVTIGQQSPIEAALRERAHPQDAHLVAETALRAFLATLTDVKVHTPRSASVEEASTAA